MKKLLLLVPLSLMSLMASANCTPAFNATVDPFLSVTNVSGSSPATVMFKLLTAYDMAGELGAAPTCTLNVTYRLKRVSTGAVVYTSTNTNLIMGSVVIGPGDPCYNSTCGCTQYRWNDGTQYPWSVTIPNQSCGAYYLELTLNSSSFSNTSIVYGSLVANNIGGTTTSCTVGSGTPSINLGQIQLVNFSGTSGLAATSSITNASCGLNNGSATINVSGGVPAYTYNWQGTTAAGATASSLGAGTYTVSVSDANGCSLSRLMTVSNYSITATISPGSQTICKDKCLTLTASATPTGSYTYTWSQSVNGGAATTIGTGTAICVRPPSLSRTQPTTVVYTVTVSNGLGCSDTKSITITVDPSCTVNFDNGCCSAGNGRLAGSGEEEIVRLAVSPNPTSDQTVISFNVPAESGYVEIYSITGKMVKRIDGLTGSGQINLDVNEFAAGTYSVVLFNGNVQMLSEKMVIVK